MRLNRLKKPPVAPVSEAFVHCTFIVDCLGIPEAELLRQQQELFARAREQQQLVMIYRLIY